jgi:ribonuclease VapC
MFIDASAIVAILNDEPEAAAFEAAIERHDRKIYVSPVARFEAVVSLASARSRKAKSQTSPEAIELAAQAVNALLETIQAQEAPILQPIADRAIAAATRFGRVVGHQADLNLGDCFAYAVASNFHEPILFKGSDFTHTDLQSALPQA